jgi:hypothetical protein
LRVLILDNAALDWRRVYVDGELAAENRPGRARLPVRYPEGSEVVFRMIDDFDLLADYVGEDD